jgi:hypothetical protein
MSRPRLSATFLAILLVGCGSSEAATDRDASAPDSAVDAPLVDVTPAVDAKETGDGRDVTPPRFDGCNLLEVKDVDTYTIGWAPAVDDVTPALEISYRVYLSFRSGGQDFTYPSARFVGVTSGTLRIPARKCREPFYVVCRAMDAAGNDDGNTFEVSPSHPDTVLPPCFAGLSGVGAITSSSVELKWDPGYNDGGSPDSIRYAVYAGPTPGAEDFTTPLVVTVTGATSTVVTGLAPHTATCFVVRARTESRLEDDNVVERCVTTL